MCGRGDGSVGLGQRWGVGAALGCAAAARPPAPLPPPPPPPRLPAHIRYPTSSSPVLHSPGPRREEGEGIGAALVRFCIRWPGLLHGHRPAQPPAGPSRYPARGLSRNSALFSSVRLLSCFAFLPSSSSLLHSPVLLTSFGPVIWGCRCCGAGAK